MITCIGEILVDRFVSENGASDKLGGAPFNVAVSIARSGGESAFVGSVGNDELGNFIIDDASTKGLKHLAINKLDGYDTTIALVTLTNGERSFKFIRDNGADFHLPFPLPRFVDSSHIVHIASLMLNYQEGRDYVQNVIRYLKRKNIFPENN